MFFPLLIFHVFKLTDAVLGEGKRPLSPVSQALDDISDRFYSETKRQILETSANRIAQKYPLAPLPRILPMFFLEPRPVFNLPVSPLLLPEEADLPTGVVSIPPYICSYVEVLGPGKVFGPSHGRDSNGIRRCVEDREVLFETMTAGMASIPFTTRGLLQKLEDKVLELYLKKISLNSGRVVGFTDPGSDD